MRRRGLKRWLLLPRRHRRLADEVRLELENHLAESVEYLVARGMSRSQAEAEASRRLGALDDAQRTLLRLGQERESAMQWREWIGSLTQDIRYTARSLGRRPAFTTFVMLTLALGIGPNVAMFSIIDRLLLQGPSHVVNPERVRRFYLTGTPPAMRAQTSDYTAYPMFDALRAETSVLSSVAAYRFKQVILGGEDAERLDVRDVTGDFFRTLGVRPFLGRFFDDRDVNLAGEPDVVVIAYALWQRRFGAASDVIGQPITLDDRSYRIIGVAPKDFTGAEFAPTDAWMPIGVRSGPFPGWSTSWSASTFQVIVRIRDGITIEQARDRAMTAFRTAYTGTTAWKRESRVELLPLRYSHSGVEPMETRVSRWLLGVAMVVLLTAFANVANMLLARGVSRQREIAVRLALGVQRWRLTRLLLAEGLLLALGGGALGLILGVWSGGVIRASLLPVTSDVGFGLDRRLLLFAVGATLVTGVALGLTAAWQSGAARLAAGLREGTQRVVVGRHIGAAFTVVQAALSLMLLVGSGLFVQSLANARGLDAGMHPERVVYASIRWRATADVSPALRASARARRQEVHRQILDRLRASPAVRFASAAGALPLRSTSLDDVRVPGRDSIPAQPGGGPFVNEVGVDYFETLGARLIAGRGFRPGDAVQRPLPIVVTETTARLLWPGESVLGKCAIVGADTNPCSPIIGVVGDIRRFALREGPAVQVFTPLNEDEIFGYLFAQVPEHDLGAFQAELRRWIAPLDPAIAYVDVGTVQDAIDSTVRPWTLGASMFSIFGALALVIAVVGLYSVVSYATANRHQEIGVRIALGAGVRDVMRLVIRSGLRGVVAGIALGMVTALAAARWLQPLLFETSARDPRVYAVVTLVLLLTAAIACVIPGRRAAKVDPLVALRSD